MTDEAPDRPEPPTEPFELTVREVELIVEALRYLETTLGREEAEQLGRVKSLLMKLGVEATVREEAPTF